MLLLPRNYSHCSDISIDGWKEIEYFISLNYLTPFLVTMQDGLNLENDLRSTNSENVRATKELCKVLKTECFNGFTILTFTHTHPYTK